MTPRGDALELPEPCGQSCWLCVVTTPESSRRPFCAAFVVDEETRKVSASAPILKWTRGRPGREVVAGLRAKGYEVQILPGARLKDRAVSGESVQKPADRFALSP